MISLRLAALLLASITMTACASTESEQTDDQAGAGTERAADTRAPARRDATGATLEVGTYTSADGRHEVRVHGSLEENELVFLPKGRDAVVLATGKIEGNALELRTPEGVVCGTYRVTSKGARTVSVAWTGGGFGTGTEDCGEPNGDYVMCKNSRSCN